jgi:hypothetical protein
VAFASAQSTHAVCAYCHSSVVRQADQLTRLGRIADEFHDYSPLKLGDTGQWGGCPFTLVGRLQFGYDNTRWTDWQVAFDDGSLASLSEDNGAFVFSKQVATPDKLPAFDAWRLGQASQIGGRRFTVSLVQPVSLLAAGGELGHLPSSDKSFGLVELRNQDGWVCSIELDSEPPTVWIGQAVELTKLGLGASATASQRKDDARHFNCPHCAARLEVTLETTMSMSCPSCDSLIDLSQGIGGELRHAIQSEPVRPVIPLGSVGQFNGESWQAVGFQHRTGKVSGEDEWFGWSEYLLYNRQRGFAFLVDSSEGWSWVTTAPGAPTLGRFDSNATYKGIKYAIKESYGAHTQYVAGEFYWPVHQGELVIVTEYARGAATLTRESTSNEITWSLGKPISSDAVGKAFGLSNEKAFQAHIDPPLNAWASGVQNLWAWMKIAFVLLMLVLMVATLFISDDCDPQTENCQSTGYRTSGGSFGGSSSGGWHK